MWTYYQIGMYNAKTFILYGLHEESKNEKLKYKYKIADNQ